MIPYRIMAILTLFVLLACAPAAPPDAGINPPTPAASVSIPAALSVNDPASPPEPESLEQQIAPVATTDPTATPEPEPEPAQSDLLIAEYASCNDRFQDSLYQQRYDQAQQALTAGDITVSQLIEQTKLQCRSRRTLLNPHIARIDQPTLAPVDTYVLPTPKPTPTPQPDPTKLDTRLQQLTSFSIAEHARELSAAHLSDPSSRNPFVAYVMHQDRVADCIQWALGHLDPTLPAQTDSDENIRTQYAAPLEQARWCFQENATDLTRAAQWLKLTSEERHYRYLELLRHAYNYHRFANPHISASRAEICRSRFMDQPHDKNPVVMPANRYQEDHHRLHRCFNPDFLPAR